ncbi:MAG TPA: hypothetical protein VM261_04240 [Kofleriaceae bacterium]|nr:hypothetical protein [Kofleriaceae bacterium]
MIKLRSLLFSIPVSISVIAVSATALACGAKSDPGTTTPPTKAAKVDIAIASVSLADDCGHGPTVAPPEPAQAQAQAPAPSAVAGDMAAGASMSMAKRACEQSSIQLRVANSTSNASKVTVQKVELLDESGNLVAELTPRDPSRWTEDSYQTWDEQVAASETLAVSYALSAPNVMRGATYTVRVVIASADGERTLETQTTLEAEASLPPGVVT